MRERALRVTLLLWSVLVLGLFLRRGTPLVAPALDSLSTVALGLISAYAFWFLGYRLCRRLEALLPGVEALERSVIEFGLGTMASIGFFIVAGALGLYQQVVAYGFLALLLTGPHGAFLANLRSRAATVRPGGPLVLMAFLALGGTMSILQSLSPVTSQDALVYHLAVPARYVEKGGFVPVEGNFFAQFPQNVEMLFTLGLLLKGPSLAQWYHWLLGAAAVASVAALSRAIHARASGLLAAAAFGTIPTVSLLAGWAYIDLGVVFFVTLSLICFLRWREAKGTSWLVLASLFAGGAAGCKYTGGFQGILLVLGVVFSTHRDGKRAREILGKGALVALIVGLVVCPWWIKNIIYTGNPLYPFCYSILGGAGWDAERAEVLHLALSRWGGEHGILETILLPWRLTMSAEFFSEENFDGMIGCAFLIGAPCIIASLRLSRASRTAALFLLAHACFWVATTRQVRFLLPALGFASALMGAALPAWTSGGWLQVLIRAAVHGAFASNLLLSSIHFASHNPVAVVLGMETKRSFLEREIPGGDYAVFEFIEEKLPKDSYILFGSLGNPGFLSKRPYYSDAFFENHALAGILRESCDPDAVWTALARRGFTHLLFRWKNVFDPSGRCSDIPLEDEKKLADFLNSHARLLAGASGTVLYELEWRIGPKARCLRERRF